MPTSADYRKEILHEVVVTLRSKLQKGSVRAERAREIARFVLQNLPKNLTKKDIFRQVPGFNENFPELANVSLKADQDYEKLSKEKFLPALQEMIAQHRSNEAVTLMKKIQNKEVDL